MKNQTWQYSLNKSTGSNSSRLHNFQGLNHEIVSALCITWMGKLFLSHMPCLAIYLNSISIRKILKKSLKSFNFRLFSQTYTYLDHLVRKTVSIQLNFVSRLSGLVSYAILLNLATDSLSNSFGTDAVVWIFGEWGFCFARYIKNRRIYFVFNSPYNPLAAFSAKSRTRKCWATRTLYIDSSMLC